MEKSRSKSKSKKCKMKTSDDVIEEPDEIPSSLEDTSLFDELQQAMLDVTEDSQPSTSKSPEIEETREEHKSSTVNLEPEIKPDIEPENQTEVIPEEIVPKEENTTEVPGENYHQNVQANEPTSLDINPYKDLQKIIHTLEQPSLEPPEVINTTETAPPLESVQIQPNIIATAPEITLENVPEFHHPRQQIVIEKLSCLNEEVLKTIQPFTETQLSSLYHNHEIDFTQEYLKEFIESQKSLQNHKLYEMLSTYLRSRNKLISAQLDIENIDKEYKANQEQIWTTQEATITESGKCQDNNTVSASHKYPVTTINQQTLNLVSRNLTAIRDLVNEVYTLHAYSSEVLRLQIEHYIQEILSYYSKVPHNTPVQLYPSNNIDKTELCICISILFMFQRRQIKDEQFINDSKDWLLKLASILLRIAIAKDHLFLLQHILRSPGGITKWAVSLIQIPLDNLTECHPSTSSALLDHCVAILYVLMQPIHGRDQFVDDKCKSLEDQWTFLDSDGDEDDTPMALLENDLVAILNQIPVDSIFRHVLGIQYRDNREFYYGENVSEKNLLQLFAFATTLIQMLKTGLKTYNTPRYRQFAKRLGRMVRHTVQYVSEQWEMFRNSNLSFDPAMLARLQVEYDNLLLRATQCILSSPCLGAWQFLAVVPYNVVSSTMLWHLFCLLHQEDGSTTTDSNTDWRAILPSLKEEFEAKLSALPEAEVYFLLSTFASMALARENQDEDFVLAVVLDLFQVGFASKATQETCSKTARSLLANITSKHPHLISSLLEQIKLHADNAGTLSVYLVKELPIHQWSPDAADMTILSEWLLTSPSTLHSSLSRSFLASLDWVRMPMSLQLQAAVLAVDACLRHAQERAGHLSPGAVAEGVSSLAAMVRNQTSPEQGLNSWAWGLLSRLRLHLNDQHTWYHRPEALTTIPDLESDPALEVISRGVREKEPIACFAALLATSWGHSVPLVCSKGVPLLNILLSHAKYDAVCEVIHHITPLFLDCPDSLASNDKFITLLTSLITADRGYVKMAKNLLLSDSPGPVLKQVANMIESQFANSQRYGVTSPDCLTDLWLHLLTSVPDWTREPCVAHLLDIVLRASYLHPAARQAAVNKLKALYRNGVAKQGGALSSLLSWLGSGCSSLIPRAACPEAPWLALFVLEVEQNENEMQTGLWRQFLVELSHPSKPTLEQAMKKASNTLKVPAVPISNLALYRWAQQALDTCLDHPLLPVFWQKFFSLYLARVPGGPDKGCVGYRFFEGLVNVSYVKRLRRRLYDAAELYEARASEPSTGEATEDESSQHRSLHARTSKMLRTYSLWLEEPRLQEPNVYLPALPPQYDPNKLALIFAGDTGPWLEFVDLQEVHEKQIDAVRDWQLQHFRHVDGSFRMPGKGDELTYPLERMMKRLHSYDKPVPAPPLRPLRCIVPYLAKEELLNPTITLTNLEQHFSTLQEFTQVHALRSSELAALDCTLLELLPTLYRECELKVTLTAACEAVARKKSTASECAGPFRVTIKVLESRLSEGIQHQITQNRNEHKGVLARSLQTPPQNVCGAAVYIENLVSKLVTCSGQGSTDQRFKDTGVMLFYHLVSMYNEQAAFYPPTKQLLTSCLEILGQVFISRDETQCERLLTSILTQPQLNGLLSPHFSPQLAPTPTFLAMYRRVVRGCQNNPDTSFAILSKFDVHQWLARARPRLRERSHFIETLGEALAASTREPPQERLILHETFLRHLRHITLHDFPEHYGEVLQLVLKGSEGQTLSLDVWWCVLDCLSEQRIRARDQLRVYATQQRLLGPQEVRETAALLASYFTKERLQYGLHGLYPKYRHYIEPLSLFMGMIGHSHVIGTLQQGRGALGDTLCDQMWPVLSELFSPWLTPYTGQQSAAWIQQLTDDRTVLLPWTALDANLAKSMTDCFVDIVQFLLDTLPACSSILCFVWQFYVTHFAMAAVKEHVLEVVHSSLSVLPWERFWPRPQDLDAMIKVVEQYLPLCHTFTGTVFVQVNWVSWVGQVHPEYLPRTLVCLMHLLVKLSVEVKQDPKVTILISDCHKHLAWHLVDAANFDLVLNWFVMSCDPRVILPGCSEVNPVDVQVLELLRHIAGFSGDCKQLHSSTVRKRLAYVRASCKLLISTSSRYKNMLSKNSDMFVAAVHSLLDSIENVIQHTGSQQISESGLLLGELLSGTSVSGPLTSILVPGICSWVSQHSGRSVVVLGLLRTLGVSVTDPRALGALLEETLTAFFRDTSAPNISWAHAVSILQPAIPAPKSQANWEPLEHVLVKEGYLLSLHALLLKRNPSEKSDQFSMLTNLVDWMSQIKMTENVERKLPMLWKLAFSLSLALCKRCLEEDGTLEQTLVLKLNQLAQCLTAVGEDKGWHLLGVIGLRKQQNASIKLRLLARTLAAFLLVQLPTSGDGDKRHVRLSSDAPGAINDISSSCLSETLEPPAPSSAALQAVGSLEALSSSKLSPELKSALEQALKSVRDPTNCLATFDVVFFPILALLYQDNFLNV